MECEYAKGINSVEDHVQSLRSLIEIEQPSCVQHSTDN